MTTKLPTAVIKEAVRDHADMPESRIMQHKLADAVVADIHGVHAWKNAAKATAILFPSKKQAEQVHFSGETEESGTSVENDMEAKELALLASAFSSGTTLPGLEHVDFDALFKGVPQVDLFCLSSGVLDLRRGERTRGGERANAKDDRSTRGGRAQPKGEEKKGITLARVLAVTGLAESQKAGRRLVDGGAVRVNGQRIEEGGPAARLHAEHFVGGKRGDRYAIVRAGKKKHALLRLCDA